MRYAPNHKEETREKLLKEAARAIRRDGPHNLAHTVGAVVKENNPIPITNTVLFDAYGLIHEWLEKLIELTLSVAFFNARSEIRGGPPDPRNKGIVGELGALPTMIPVHAKVAPCDTSEVRAFLIFNLS